MHPIIFKFGIININSYGLMIAIGMAAAILMALYRGKKIGIDQDNILDISIYGILGGVIGAKLLYLIQELPDIIKNPSSIKYMLLQGFVVYGGIIGGVFSGYLYCRVKKISFIKHFDLVAPSIALAQGFGRIGCFLAGCCYGRPTNSFLGVEFNNSFIAPHGIKLLPTQIYSSIGDFFIAAILVFYASKRPKKGKTASLYLILYSIGRFVVEYLRDDPRGNIGFLSTSQFICIFVLICGISFYNIEKILSSCLSLLKKHS